MPVLVWPRNKDEPLPATPGLVVGWKQDQDTIICARVLHHTDNVLLQHIMNHRCDSGGLQLLGRWDPQNDGEVWPDAEDFPTFAPTRALGPWWVGQGKKEGDVLVYYSPKQTYSLDTDDTQAGLAPILERLNQVKDIVKGITGMEDDSENDESLGEKYDRPANTMHRDPLQHNMISPNPLSLLARFSTILGYYVFFRLVCVILRPVGLWLVYGFVHEQFPLLNLLWKRWSDPSQMGVGIYQEEQSPSTTWLRVSPRSYTTSLTIFACLRIAQLISIPFAKLATGKRLSILSNRISEWRTTLASCPSPLTQR